MFVEKIVSKRSFHRYVIIFYPVELGNDGVKCYLCLYNC